MVGEKPPSQYITLQLPGHRSTSTKKHWVGWKEIFDVSGTNDTGLVEVAARLEVPQHYRKIPRQLERFHVPGYWFKIYETKGEIRRAGFPRMERDYFYETSMRLIFSEDYLEVMREIRKRGLEKEVGNEKKKMKRKGQFFLDVSVMSPEIEEMWRIKIRELERIRERERASRGGSDIPLRTAISA